MYVLGMVLFTLLVWASGAEADCGGSDKTWTCTAGTTSAQLQSAINSATDGATLTFAAGSYAWNSFTSFSNSKGVTLICSTPQACKVTVGTGTVLGMNDNLSGTNTKLYRISGFVFQDAPSGSMSIWFYGAGTMTQLRIDHNTFQNYGNNAIAITLGENSTVAAFYGVIDHNTLTGSTNTMLAFILGATNPTAPVSPKGTANNMFLENNIMTFRTMGNAGHGCTDGWGGGTIVWRYNATTNCLITSHGVVHKGGPFNFEFYGNSMTATAGAGENFSDGYRLFHHQGSGEFLSFNNTFTASSGKNASALAMTHYRSASPAAAGYNDPPGRCDGTKSIDGNRSLNTTYFGYPCWRQPGRDGAGNLQPMYVWNNRWSDTRSKIDINIENPWGATNPSVNTHIANDRDYYNAVSASAQSSVTSPFNGTTGMGFGTLANRPTTCTTNPSENGGGVGYFATDKGPQGTLYRCSATNIWSVQYTPYTYPHPMTIGDGGEKSSPSPPINLKIQ